MKPLQWAVLGAVLAVAAILYLLNLDAGSDRQQNRRAAEERTTDGRREGGDARAESDARGAGAKQSSAGLVATLKVVRADGSPAAGAAVTLMGPTTRTDATGSDGSVELGNLAPGIYNLIARSDSEAGALDFEIEKSTDLGTLALQATVAIRGHVLDPRGAAVAGATVEATRVREGGAFDLTSIMQGIMRPERVAARTQTGEDGAFELFVQAGETLALRAAARGFAQEAEEPRVYASDVDGLEFRLFEGLTVAGIVVNTSGEAVAGARVMLINPMQVFQSKTPKAETMTDADGRFSLATTAVRNLLLAVRAAGYATSMQSNVTVPAPNMRIALEAGITLRLRAVNADQPGAPAPDVSVAIMYRGGFVAGKTDEAGNLVLENLPVKGSRMWGNQQQAMLWGGGFVSLSHSLAAIEPIDGLLDVGEIGLQRGGTIKGKVIDKSTGDAIAGVHLRSMGGLDRQLEFMGGATTTSGADGKYELTGVPLKVHTVLAMHPDYLSNVDPMVVMQSLGGRGASNALFPAGKRQIDQLVELLPAATLTGVVVGPDGTPVAGAKVAVQDSMAMIRAMMGGGIPSAISDAEGTFTLTGLRKGKAVRVIATHRDFGSSKAKSIKTGDEPSLELTEPLTLKGVVFDTQNEPIAGTRVQVTRVTEQAGNTFVDTNPGGSGATSVRPGVTDAQGRYTILNAPPGKLKVIWDHRDYAPTNRTIDVAPGTEEFDLGRTELDAGNSLKGVVVDEKGKPVPGVNVNASFDYGDATQTVSPGGTSIETGRTNGNTTSDEDGHFAIRGLRAGKFRIQSWQQGSYSSRPIAEAGSTDIRITLTPAAKLVGRVTSRGKAIATASVSASIPKSGRGNEGKFDSVAWARTDADGNFRLESLPPDQPLKIEVRHDGYRTLTREGVRATDDAQVFELDAGVQIAGTVRDASGTPVARVGLRVRVGEGRNSNKHITADADGHFEAGGLDEGEITVQVQSWNQNFIATEPLVVEPGDRNIEIVVEAGESIAGFILDADGTPLKQVQLAALDENDNQVASGYAWTEDGSFEIKGLRKGRYTVRATRWADAKSTVLAVATDVATGTLDLELRAGR